MANTIMSVDDSFSMRTIIKTVLTTGGYELIEAENGVDALDKVQAEPDIDLFIIDVNMPKMDGISLIKELRTKNKYKAIPMIVLTTEAKDDKKAEGQAAGATGWIVKPFDSDKLLKVVSTLLS